MKVGNAELKWLGHAGFMLIKGEKTIYIDPYEIGRSRPDADYILITHDHYDHLSIEDIDRIATEETTIISPADCRDKLQSIQGHLRIMKAGDEIDFPELTVKAVPAYNKNKKFHPKNNGWLGYILEFDGKKLYHAGDTDHIPEMKNVEADVALLPISGTYVMTPEEAAKAAKDIGCGRAVPMHYGSFIGDKTDAEKFKKAAPCPVYILDKE